MTAADGTKIAEDLRERYEHLIAIRNDRPTSRYYPANYHVEAELIERVSRAEERERVLQAKLLLWESEGVLALVGADKMASVCDDWVKRGLIDGRSAFADARLAYCDPYTFKWPEMKAEFAALATPAQPQTGGSK